MFVEGMSSSWTSIVCIECIQIQCVVEASFVIGGADAMNIARAAAARGLSGLIFMLFNRVLEEQNTKTLRVLRSTKCNNRSFVALRI